MFTVWNVLYDFPQGVQLYFPVILVLLNLYIHCNNQHSLSIKPKVGVKDRVSVGFGNIKGFVVSTILFENKKNQKLGPRVMSRALRNLEVSTILTEDKITLLIMIRDPTPH